MKAGSAPLWSVCVVTLILASPAALAQTNEEMNAANNPLQPAASADLQNIYVDSYYGLDDADSNSALLRGVLPHKFFGRPQILRATLPIVTTPDLQPPRRKTDFGDLNLFDIVLTKAGKFELGLGPQLTARSGSSPLRSAIRSSSRNGRYRTMAMACPNFRYTPA